LRGTEEIRDAGYLKVFSGGAIGGMMFNELLKQFTKPKKSNKEEKNIDQVQVRYFCPSSLSFLFESEDGLITDVASQIEQKITKDSIKQYSRNKYWFLSINDRFKGLVRSYLNNNVNYAAALYLINEDQRKSFKEKFAEGCSVYNLYKIGNLTSLKDLWCYALPLLRTENGYECQIDLQVTNENIDTYSFKLTSEDSDRITLRPDEIIGVEFKSRNNKTTTIP
jgi:hypothetical protein